jgi:hypothetical protein
VFNVPQFGHNFADIGVLLDFGSSDSDNFIFLGGSDLDEIIWFFDLLWKIKTPAPNMIKNKTRNATEGMTYVSGGVEIGGSKLVVTFISLSKNLSGCEVVITPSSGISETISTSCKKCHLSSVDGSAERETSSLKVEPTNILKFV